MAQAAEIHPERRIWGLATLSLVLLGVLAWRLVDLQVLRHDYFVAAAETQRQRASELTPHRGTIYFSESRASTTGDDVYPVATNQRAWFVYAVPREMDDPNGVADQLAPALLSFRERQREREAEIIVSSGQSRGVAESI